MHFVVIMNNDDVKKKIKHKKIFASEFVFMSFIVFFKMDSLYFGDLREDIKDLQRILKAVSSANKKAQQMVQIIQLRKALLKEFKSTVETVSSKM